MVKLLSYLRECIDLANGLTGIVSIAGVTRKKANEAAGSPSVPGSIWIDKVRQIRRAVNAGLVKASQASIPVLLLAWIVWFTLGDSLGDASVAGSGRRRNTLRLCVKDDGC
jgi:hypothetical protein